MNNPIPHTIQATWGRVPDSILELENPFPSGLMPHFMSAAGGKIHIVTGGAGYSYKTHFKVPKNVPNKNGDCFICDMEAPIPKEAVDALIASQKPPLIFIDSYAEDALKAQAETAQSEENPKKFTGYKRPKKSDGNWMGKRK